MRPGNALALGAALLFMLSTGAGAAEDTPAPESPSALLDRAFKNLYGDDFVQVLSLSTQRRGSQSMVRRIQLLRKQSEQPGKALVRFLEPPEVRRTSVLILETAARYDDFFVFLPALGKVRRISSSQRADAFFGTDLAFEDIEPKRAADWEVKLEGPGDEGGTPCAVLDIRPRAAGESTYERMVSCVDPVRGVILRTDFWRRGEPLKRLLVRPGDVREVAGRQIPFVFTMATPRVGSETVVATESYEIRAKLPDGLFTAGNLEIGDADGDRRLAGSR
jgi:hypothetical protein